MFGSSPMLPPVPQVPTLAPSDSGFYSHGNPSSVQVCKSLQSFFFQFQHNFRIQSIVALSLWIVSQILVENVVFQEVAMVVEDFLLMLTCQTMEAGAASREGSCPWWIALCPP